MDRKCPLCVETNLLLARSTRPTYTQKKVLETLFFLFLQRAYLGFVCVSRVVFFLNLLRETLTHKFEIGPLFVYREREKKSYSKLSIERIPTEKQIDTTTNRGLRKNKCNPKPSSVSVCHSLIKIYLIRNIYREKEKESNQQD